MFQGSPDAEKKLVFFERFQDVIVGATANGLQCGRDIMHGRDHDHGDLRIMPTQPGEQLQAVHFRHQHVAEHHIGGIRLQMLNSQPAILYRRAMISLILEQGRDDLAYRLLIIHNEDLGFTHLAPPEGPGLMHRPL